MSVVVICLCYNAKSTLVEALHGRWSILKVWFGVQQKGTQIWQQWGTDEGQGVVGGGLKRFGDLVSTRDVTEERMRRREGWRFDLNRGWNGGQGEEERGWETWSQPGIERRTGCYNWVIRMS